MGAVHDALQIVATGEEATRCALNEARRFADGEPCRLVLLVPYVQSRFASPADRDEAAALRERYRALAAAAGVDAVVRVCICRRLDDVFRWMLGRHSRVIVGGRCRRWWPTAAQRLAQRLERLGHDVTFAML
jgi:hypothetical protein